VYLLNIFKCVLINILKWCTFWTFSDEKCAKSFRAENYSVDHELSNETLKNERRKRNFDYFFTASKKAKALFIMNSFKSDLSQSQMKFSKIYFKLNFFLLRSSNSVRFWTIFWRLLTAKFTYCIINVTIHKADLIRPFVK
jgi:hypothetical protein